MHYRYRRTEELLVEGLERFFCQLLVELEYGWAQGKDSAL
jgi:hypothetical protein